MARCARCRCERLRGLSNGKRKPIERRAPRHGKAHVEMGDEGMMHLNVTMTAAATGGGAVGVIAKPFAKSTEEDAMTAVSEALAAVGADGKELPEVVTLASGNLGRMRRWLADLGHDAYDDERAASAV